MLQPELTLIDDFAPQDETSWRRAVVAALGEAGSPDKLTRATEDGLPVRVLYTLADMASRDRCPGQPAEPRRWAIRQICTGANTGELAEVVALETSGGSTAVLLELGDLHPGAADMAHLLAGIDAAAVGIALGTGADAALAEGLLQGLCHDGGTLAGGGAPPRVSLGLDPLGALATQAHLPQPLDATYDGVVSVARLALQACPGARTLRISTRPYHLAGATACQDIAFALATGLEYLRRLSGPDMSPADAARQIEFSFHLDCRFLEGAATLRAARLLWRQMLATLGITGDELRLARMCLHVQTGERVLTQRDPYVNLLRNTACVLAGALAGADAITTLPHDLALGQSSDFARRVARNTQLVLQRESGLHRVADPLGGSYFVESLTRQMAARAWEFVRQIEAAGGMFAALTSAQVHDWIATARTARCQRLETKEQLLTGVTAFADPQEQPPPAREATRRKTAARPSDAAVRIQPLPANRLAEPFEWSPPAAKSDGGAA